MMSGRATTKSPASLLIFATVSACAAFCIAVLINSLRYPAALNCDFMAFWSYPRFAAGHPVGQIYDGLVLQNFQQQLYPGFRSFYPYLYPPTLLLPTWWLRFFSFAAAERLWTGLGLALFIPACLLLFCRYRWLVLAALLASPASLLNGVTGETGYFTSGLMFLGLALLPARPVLAGFAFGLLTLKPQLTPLIPFLLLARGDWVALATAGLTAAAIVALSCLALPPALWPLWLHSLAGYQESIFAGHGINLHIVITPAANLVTFGLAPAKAWVAQIICFVLAAIAVFAVARRAPYPLASACLLIGGFLAVPHAYIYDSIPLIGAMALCLQHARPALWLVLLGALIYAAPLLVLSPAAAWFVYAPAEAVLFAATVTLALRAPPSAALTPAPALKPAAPGAPCYPIN